MTAKVGKVSYTAAVASTSGAAGTVRIAATKLTAGSGSATASVTGSGTTVTSNAAAFTVRSTAVTSTKIARSATAVYPTKDGYKDSVRFSVSSKTTTGTTIPVTGWVKVINSKGKTVKSWTLESSKSWSATYERQHPPGFRWLHEDFGTNWRMLEMQAAIGRIQLRRMPVWHAQRKANAEATVAAARSCPALRVPVLPADCEHAWYRCYVFVRPDMLRAGWDRDRIVQEISAAGVTKAAGLAWLCERHGVTADQVVAFGDMPNDIPLLSWAGRGVAVGNAHPALRAVADEVTDTNDEDGVARYLRVLFNL